MEPNRGGLPKTVSQLFPSKWLTAADLQKPTTATIVDAAIEELRQADGSKEMKLIVTFRNATKRWVTNQTQCKALAEGLGTEVFADWVGCRVTLAKGRAQNGKDTIVVSAAFRPPAEVGPASAPVSRETPAADNPRNQPAASGMTEDQAADMWRMGADDGRA